MNLPKGVTVELYNELDVEPLAPNAKGYLGTFTELNLLPLNADRNEYADIMIEVVVKAGRDIHAFYVDPEKDTYECRNYALDPDGDDDSALEHVQGTKVFRQYAPIKLSKKSGTPTTMFPSNNIRLLEAIGDGWYKLWRISVVTQSDKFFLTTEENEPIRVYQSDVNIICPALEVDDELERKGWPRLKTLLKTFIHGDEFFNLPDVSEVANDPPLDKRVKTKPNGIKDNQAIVVWFSEAEQLGLTVCRQDGKIVVARAHVDNMAEPRSYDEEERLYLLPGEIIEFEKIGEPNQTTDRETSFKHEVYGFRLVQSS